MYKYIETMNRKLILVFIMIIDNYIVELYVYRNILEKRVLLYSKLDSRTICKLQYIESESNSLYQYRNRIKNINC